MIARLTGKLEGVAGGKAYLAVGEGVVYEVLLPAFAASRLGGDIGRAVTLHTLLFLEGTAQGATMFPRLAGFLTADDKAFFELFVTVKGIGHRKALRAFALPAGQIAGAIEDRDVKLLQTLPEVGKRTAETIAITLKDKVGGFVSSATCPSGGRSGDVAAPSTGLAREALEVLLQLGENRRDAVQWIDEVLSRDDAPDDAQAVVQAVYRLKGAG